MKQNVSIISELSKDTFKELDHRKIAVVVDENTFAHCYFKVAPFLPETHDIIPIQSGEEHKNLTTCQAIWQQLTDKQFNRKDFVINLGGGVIGDMGGFCAASFKRGIAFMQMPTTLLAQVDASIGGKLGIDFQGLKNHIGMFQIPNKVLIYPSFLETLPQRELLSGYAEVLKHALIANAEEWKTLIQHSPLEKNWNEVIASSFQIKFKVVEQDPREQGLRKILNFGHTIGHAIESFFLDSPSHEKLLHGEAIAIGMLCEAYLSHKINGLAAQELQEITTYIRSVYNKVALRESTFETFLQYMNQDKKNEDAHINFSLLKQIGEASFNNRATRKQITEALHWYNRL